MSIELRYWRTKALESLDSQRWSVAVSSLTWLVWQQADLVCQFVDDPASWCPGGSTATLNGTLLDRRAVEGTDEICIVP